jgi:hypothetical protein
MPAPDYLNTRARCALWLAALCASACVHAAAFAGGDLPPGWQPLDAPPGTAPLSGHFQQPGATATALLAQNTRDARHGLAIVADAADAAARRPAVIVETFSAGGPNPPRLSIVTPGTYQPRCAANSACAPLVIANDAIGLCFGEASCTVIYFDGATYREAAMTD